MSPPSQPESPGEPEGENPEDVSGEHSISGRTGDEIDPKVVRDEIMNHNDEVGDEKLDTANIDDSVNRDPENLGIPPQIKDIPLHKIAFGMMLLSPDFVDDQDFAGRENILSAFLAEGYGKLLKLADRKDVSATDLRVILSQTTGYHGLIEKIRSETPLREKDLPKVDDKQKARIRDFIKSLEPENLLDSYMSEFQPSRNKDEHPGAVPSDDDKVEITENADEGEQPEPSVESEGAVPNDMFDDFNIESKPAPNQTDQNLTPRTEEGETDMTDVNPTESQPEPTTTEPAATTHTEPKYKIRKMGDLVVQNELGQVRARPVKKDEDGKIVAVDAHKKSEELDFVNPTTLVDPNVKPTDRTASHYIKGTSAFGHSWKRADNVLTPYGEDSEGNVLQPELGYKRPYRGKIADAAESHYKKALAAAAVILIAALGWSLYNKEANQQQPTLAVSDQGDTAKDKTESELEQLKQKLAQLEQQADAGKDKTETPPALPEGETNRARGRALYAFTNDQIKARSNHVRLTRDQWLTADDLPSGMTVQEAVMLHYARFTEGSAQLGIGYQFSATFYNQAKDDQHLRELARKRIGVAIASSLIPDESLDPTAPLSMPNPRIIMLPDKVIAVEGALHYHPSVTDSLMTSEWGSRNLVFGRFHYVKETLGPLFESDQSADITGLALRVRP